MRSDVAGRKGRYLALLVLPAALLALRQAIVLLGVLVPDVGTQQALVEARGIRPADLFYTQAPLALAAEKEVRRRVAAAGAGEPE